MKDVPEDGRPASKLQLADQAQASSPGAIDALLDDFRQAFQGVFSDLGSSGRRWAKGRSEQEIARAGEIYIQTVDRIGRLVLDQAEQSHRHRIEKERHDVEMERLRSQHNLESWERVIMIYGRLRELGADVDMQKMLATLIPSQHFSVEDTS